MVHDSDHDTELPPFFRVGDFLVRPTLKSVRPFQGFEVTSSIAEDRGLTDKAMAVLVLLAERPRQLWTRENLLDAVWGPDREAFDRVLDTAISEIRRAFGDNPRKPDYVQTIPKQGYRLIAEVERPQVPPPEPGLAPGRQGPEAAEEARAFPSSNEAPRGRGLIALLLGLAVLFSFGIHRALDEDRVRVVLTEPEIGTGVVDETGFDDRLLEALTRAAACQTTFERRSLSFLSRSTLASSLRRQADGGFVLTLTFSDRGSEPIEVAQSSAQAGLDVESLIGSAAYRLAREVDHQICLSGEPGGADRACHCLAAGTSLVFRRRWSDARDALNRAVEQAPTRWQAYDRLANLDNILGHDERALKWVERGLQQVAPGSVEEMKLQRRRAQITNAFEDEEVLLKALEKQNPEDDETLLAIGWYEMMHARDCRASSGRLGDAAIHDPSSVPLAYRGFTHLTCGEYPEAIEAFQTYARNEPDSVDAQESLAMSYRLAGQYPAAEEAIRSARSLDKNFDPAWFQLAELALAEGRIKRAREVYDVIEERFDWPAAQVQLAVGRARTARDAGDLEASKQHAASALRLRPDQVEALWVQGLVAIDEGDLASAAEHAQRIRELRGDRGSRWGMEYHEHLLARIALRDQRFDEAYGHFLNALAMRPQELPFFTAELAEGLRAAGRDSEAERRFLDALALNPRHRVALCGLAQLYERLGLPDKAMAQYDRFAAVVELPEGPFDRQCSQRRQRLQIRPGSVPTR